MAKSINDQPLEHLSRNGVRFVAERSDLDGGVTFEKPNGLSETEFAQDVAEFAAWHRSCIWEQLNGFRGYSRIGFIEQPKNRPKI